MIILYKYAISQIEAVVVTPPPALTAYFSKTRMPGVVLLVSTIVAFVPQTAQTALFVAVAIHRHMLNDIQGDSLSGKDAL